MKPEERNEDRLSPVEAALAVIIAFESDSFLTKEGAQEIDESMRDPAFASQFISALKEAGYEQIAYGYTLIQ